jgi:hypothetical protein
MGGGEVVGDIAQGALLARAVEPRHGEASEPGHTHESACLNCGTPLVGSHCHACGQAAHVHKTLAAFFHDLAHGVFHFEGKIWRTLPLLAWRPGRLTREYIDGRRASYVSPIALFLFCVFLLFAAIRLALPQSIDGVGPSMAEALANSRADIASLEARRAKADPFDLAEIETRLSREKAQLAELEELRAKGITDIPSGLQKADIHSSIPWLDRGLKKAQENPQLLVYKLQSSAYKYSWLLIPISVPFIWLLFPFSRRFGLYDHTVFVTYSLCFMTLLVVALSLAGWAGLSGLWWLALGIVPWHLYRQLRGTYELGRNGALWRLAALLVVCTATLLMFTMAVVSLGVT